MTWLQTIVLAIVQGITEFLPISSSAHLILVPYFADWPDQGLGFDLAVHLGTLVAVVVYFRSELHAMGRDWLRSVRQRQTVGESRLTWGVLLGTIPVAVAGLAFGSVIETTLRSPAVIATTTIGFAMLLLLADFARGRRTEHMIRWRDVAVVGLAQAIALVPGTSRSGITIIAGLLMGLSREGAARFSFLLAIPVTALAGGYKMLKLATGPESVEWQSFLVGGVIAAVTAFLCIHYFLKFLTRFGLLPYVAYRLLLGGVLVMLMW